MERFIQDFLLLNSTNIDHVLRIVKDVSTPLLTLTFAMGAVFENLGGQNYLGLFKRLIIALFLISFGSGLLKSSVSLSFDISGRILKSSQKSNPVVQLIERARKLSKKVDDVKRSDGLVEKSKNAASGLWESTAFVTKFLWDDGLSSVVFIISYTSLLLLGQFYTIVYNFTYVSIPIIATLIVFPPTYSVANSLSRSISWLFLMPIFTMVTILLLSMSFAFPQSGAEEYYFTSFENLINFCLMAIMLLLIPTIVSGFLSGSGILSAAETFSKTTAMAVATGGKSLILDKAKNLTRGALFGENYGAITLGRIGLNKGLDKIGNRSIEARNRLSARSGNQAQGTSSQLNQNAQTLKNEDKVALNSRESKRSETDMNKKSQTGIFTAVMDRTAIASDSVLNFKKNTLARKALSHDLRRSPEGLGSSEKTSLFNTYKRSAHDKARILRPIDQKASRLRESLNRSSQHKPFGESGKGIHHFNRRRPIGERK